MLYVTIIFFYIRQSSPCTGLDRPWGFKEVEAPRFQDNRHIMVIRLSALRTGRLYPPGNIPGTYFCWRLSKPQCHSAAWRIMSMKNFNDTIGDRTRDLPAWGAVPQPTTPPRTPCFIKPLTPNDPNSGRTAPLTSKRCILYIYSTNICSEYFKHGIYSPFFPLQNAVCFIILTYLVPVLFTFYIQDVLKLKIKIPAP